MGGFAQLFCTMFQNPVGKEVEVAKIMQCMLDRVHRPYHVELLWYAVGRIRRYYLVEKKEEAHANKTAKKDSKKAAKKAKAKSPTKAKTTRAKAKPVTPSPVRRSTRSAGKK